MRVLIACEYSSVVRDSFRNLGHDAWSCDLEDCEGDPQYHIKGDVLPLLKDNWDLLIAHPPCTYLTNTAVYHLKHDGSKFKKRDPNVLYGIPRWEAMYEAAMFFRAFQECDIPRVCIENPIPHKFARGYIGPYTQKIQPYEFGHLESKATCLWLKGLPPLKPTNNVYHEMMKLDKKERQKNHYTSPGPDRWKIRSRTYQGIGEAMATQWSPYI